MSTYIDSSKEINDKDLKFKTGDIVRISKYNNIFAKGYTSNSSEENFVIKKVKNTYATKADLKNATIVDWSDFAKKTDLANLESDVN